MIRTDERSGVVAVVPDRVLNPTAARYAGSAGPAAAVLDVLLTTGVGLMTLPPAEDPQGAEPTRTIARDLVDYLRHGYRVVIVQLAGEDDTWAAVLDDELTRWGEQDACERTRVAADGVQALADLLRTGDDFRQDAPDGRGAALRP